MLQRAASLAPLPGRQVQCPRCYTSVWKRARSNQQCPEQHPQPTHVKQRYCQKASGCPESFTLMSSHTRASLTKTPPSFFSLQRNTQHCRTSHKSDFYPRRGSVKTLPSPKAPYDFHKPAHGRFKEEKPHTRRQPEDPGGEQRFASSALSADKGLPPPLARKVLVFSRVTDGKRGNPGICEHPRRIVGWVELLRERCSQSCCTGCSSSKAALLLHSCQGKSSGGREDPLR